MNVDSDENVCGKPGDANSADEMDDFSKSENNVKTEAAQDTDNSGSVRHNSDVTASLEETQGIVCEDNNDRVNDECGSLSVPKITPESDKSECKDNLDRKKVSTVIEATVLENRENDDQTQDLNSFYLGEDKTVKECFTEHPSLCFNSSEIHTHEHKTREDQLIDDVRLFYPEIEFSKAVSNIIQEGRAYIIKQSKNVFYNPVQEFNRDISVLAVSIFSNEHENDPRCRSRGTKRKANDKEGDYKISVDDGRTGPRVPGVKYDNGIVILEALSATGLRSIRYAKEVPGVKEIVANDIAIAAVEAIKTNIEYNGVADLVTTSHYDASLLMYMKKAQGNFFDVVDLDPYGCPSRFLDSAVQCVRDGGLLLVTCTDMAVLAGNSPETCYVKYGAISLRNPACHEMALRIALQCIESHANRYGRYIVPQLSFSADFYIRVIVKVYTSPAMCKKTTSKLVMVYQCAGCQSLSYWPLGSTENYNNSVKYHLSRGPPVGQECCHCGSSYYQGGPIWSGPLHNSSFVEKMLSQLEGKDFVTEKRMEGMLELIREELVETLLYYTIDSLCSKVHCEVIPRNKFVSAILHAGYKVTLSHAAPNSVKTNAPVSVIWDIIRCWVQEHPVNPKRLNQRSVAERLLSTDPRLEANFNLHPEVMPWNKKKLLRYQQNPLPFWGPGTRDRNNYKRDKMSKSFTNQNKKCKRVTMEREKAQMKAKINSKNIDIIEVVTLTDDDDDNDTDHSKDYDRLMKSNNGEGDSDVTTNNEIAINKSPNNSDLVKNDNSVENVSEIKKDITDIEDAVTEMKNVESKDSLLLEEKDDHNSGTKDEPNEEKTCPEGNDEKVAADREIGNDEKTSSVVEDNTKSPEHVSDFDKESDVKCAIESNSSSTENTVSNFET